MYMQGIFPVHQVGCVFWFFKKKTFKKVTKTVRTPEFRRVGIPIVDFTPEVFSEVREDLLAEWAKRVEVGKMIGTYPPKEF